MTTVPFDGGGFIPPVTRGSGAERQAAARTVARLARGDRDALITVLEALGLIPTQETP